jgi:very-short-patch-repair endonuclease
MDRTDTSNRRLDARRSQRQMASRIERSLWEALRGRRFRGLKFRRQHSIGPYIADFYCDQLKLVVEADGAIHNGPDQSMHDIKRDAWMERQGFTVVRLPEDEIISAMPLALARIDSALRVNTQG